MDVTSISPLRTGSVLWRPRPDRWTLTVVCKATYALEAGESGLAPEQMGVNEHDGFWDDDARRSVFAPSDLAPFKPRADVILVGHAYAPRSELVRSLTARLLVGEMEKAIEVFCPRVLGREGDLREGQRWSKMPLRYEYAAGGPPTWNPVGIAPDAPADPYGQRALPNLQPLGLVVRQWSDIFVPAGFGPISPSWRLRREKLGRRAEGWSDEAWTRIALDDDFDGEFFQTAPPDQQIDALRDDERLVLEYLNPEHPSLTTKLPGLHPHAFVEIPGTPPRDLVMTADTLWIDTDRAICTLTWRGQVAVDGPEQRGRVLVAVEQAGQHFTWAAISGLLPVGAAVGDEPATGPRRVARTLPFHTPEVSSSPPSSSSADGEPPATPRNMGPRRTLQMDPEVPPPGPAEPLPPPTPRTTGPRRTLQMGPDAPPPESAPPPTPRTLPPPRLTMPMPEVPPTVPTWLAAGVERVERMERVERVERAPEVPPSGETAPAPAPAPIDAPVAPPVEPQRALELTWFARALGPRLREDARFTALLSGEPAPAAAAAAVLSRGTPSAADLEGALFASTGPDGVLAPPLVLLEGELSFSFDEVEALRAVIRAAMPLARVDVQLAGLIELAEELAKTELQGSPRVAEELCLSLQQAWSQANKVLPDAHLTQQVERALLARRCYQRRELLGAPWIRAVLTPSPTAAADAMPVPAYLPASASARLPLARAFPARLLARVLPQQDPYEASPVLLCVDAVARVIVRRT